MNIETINKIKNKNDFLTFMKERVISDDNQVQLNEYLESVISWVEDMDGFYNNTGIKQPLLGDSLSKEIILKADGIIFIIKGYKSEKAKLIAVFSIKYI